MSGYETLLFIHIIGAFAVVAGLATATPLVFSANVDKAASDRLTTFSRALFGAGGGLTLIFGLWLVADRDYRFFKAWIIGSLVLWLVAAATGNKIEGPKDKALYVAAAAAVTGVFLLMIFKPGV